MKPRRGGILINVNKKEDAFLDTLMIYSKTVYIFLRFACAAANRAIGTLKGEQLT